MNKALIFAAVLNLSGVSIAHAQGTTTFVGLREAFWRDVVDPSGAVGFSYMPHCRQFGMGMIENSPSPGYPYFALKTDSTLATDRWLRGTTALHVQQAVEGADRVTFAKPPLPWC
ncbi:hypothetical protein P3T24_000928 [Paraburkholderia sp. GAS33]|uniref:hypothetical protein n=1 Tax=Paraburkholderia sp. GAS33 TaxID=3035130 RepID=UPI003D21BA07